MKTNPALSALRHHVTGAIARGEAQAITEVPAPYRDCPHVAVARAAIAKARGLVSPFCACGDMSAAGGIRLSTTITTDERGRK